MACCTHTVNHRSVWCPLKFCSDATWIAVRTSHLPNVGGPFLMCLFSSAWRGFSGALWWYTITTKWYIDSSIPFHRKVLVPSSYALLLTSTLSSGAYQEYHWRNPLSTTTIGLKGIRHILLSSALSWTTRRFRCYCVVHDEPCFFTYSCFDFLYLMSWTSCMISKILNISLCYCLRYWHLIFTLLPFVQVHPCIHLA